MIINKTHNLMGDRFSKKVKWKSLLESLFLLGVVLLKYFNKLVNHYYFITIFLTITIGIVFLYHLYLIVFYDLRIVFITRLMKQNFNDDTSHLKLFRKDNEDDLNEFHEKLNQLTINLFIINHKNIIYTSNIIISDDIKLLYIIHSDDIKEYLYEVLEQ